MNKNNNDNVHIGEGVNFSVLGLTGEATIGAGALAAMIACLLLDSRILLCILLGCVTHRRFEGLASTV